MWCAFTSLPIPLLNRAAISFSLFPSCLGLKFHVTLAEIELEIKLPFLSSNSCGYSVESIDLKSRTPNQLSDKITCTVGFINCFLKVPLACLGCRVQDTKVGTSMQCISQKQFTKPTVRVILSLSKIEFKLKKMDLVTQI